MTNHCSVQILQLSQYRFIIGCRVLVHRCYWYSRG